MLLIIIFCLFFYSNNLYAQAEWVYTGDGARAAGMGGAFTAISDDSTAVFWNPAGLGQVKNVEISFNVIADKWFEFNNTTFCLPLLIPSLGDLGTIAYAESNYTPEHFIPPEFVLYSVTGISYGLKIPFLYPHFHAGATVKYIEENIDYSIQPVFLADIGLLLRIEYFCLGMTVTNYKGKEFDLLKTAPSLSSLHTKYRAGTAWNGDNFVMALDLETELDNGINSINDIPWDIVFSTYADVIKKVGLEVCIYGKTKYYLQEVPKPVKLPENTPLDKGKPADIKMIEYYSLKAERAKKVLENAPPGTPPPVEYQFVKTKITKPVRVFLRAGYVDDPSYDGRLTLGIGITLKYLKLDFSAAGETSQISLSLRF